MLLSKIVPVFTKQLYYQYFNQLNRPFCMAVKIHKDKGLTSRTSTNKNLATCESSTNSNNLDKAKKDLPKGPGLEHFITNSFNQPHELLSKRELKNISHPYITPADINGHGRSVYFDIYGCPMNVSDAEIVWSILESYGYKKSDVIEDADVVLIVTCSIRDSAEQKIWKKVHYLKNKKRSNRRYPMKIGILGCMAERLKSKLIEQEKIIDIVAGPDSYRDLPRLLAISEDGQSSVNVLLSLEETYADIMPISLSKNKLHSYVSIMRGCDNMCTYCIVPFTRGKERSRSLNTIVDEIKYLSDQGVKEVTLLGQNVNSYRDLTNVDLNSSFKNTTTINSEGFKTIYKTKESGARFSELLDKVSLVDPEMRIRFTSPHPKDFPDEVLQLIKERNNICNCLHLPAQCGSSRILQLMNRGYTREAYLKLVDHIRSIIPNIALTTDMICGFCTETEEEFEETLTLIRQVRYDFCYGYPYSMREKTKAHRSLIDDVPKEVKSERSQKMHEVFRDVSLQVKKRQIGESQIILVEGYSKRSTEYLTGRNDGNIKVIIPDIYIETTEGKRKAKVGDYVKVVITDASSLVFHGLPQEINTLYNHYLNLSPN